ncbi:MAG: SRPBCC family protein [Candidatus Marinimicrobia bacterium]|nr:SRPBCC family protein [Candidatus Neomarinimicrobiota bacterium]
MIKITKEVEINAPKAKVWSVLADIGAVEKYNPVVTKSYSTSENKQGLGASRHCDLLPMGSVEEKIIEWDEGESYKIEIFEGKAIPFKGTGKFELTENGKSTNVKMTFEPDMGNGIFGKIMGFMMKEKMNKMITGVVIGLKHHLETDELVSAKTYKKIRKLSAAS